MLELEGYGLGFREIPYDLKKFENDFKPSSARSYGPPKNLN